MVLVEEIIQVNSENSTKYLLKKIYINTLIPYFNFKNKKGKIKCEKHFCAKL